MAAMAAERLAKGRIHVTFDILEQQPHFDIVMSCVRPYLICFV